MGDLSQMHSSAGMVGYLESAIPRNAAGSFKKLVSSSPSSQASARHPKHEEAKSEMARVTVGTTDCTDYTDGTQNL